MKKNHFAIITLAIALLILSSFIIDTEWAKAYSVCRKEMMNMEGYGIWKYKETSFVLLPDITIVFDDGYNSAECYIRRNNEGWHKSRDIWQTTVGCLDCPREKYGVNP